jgi:hypothetical protein
MGRSWSGFLPQNEIAKLQWIAMEASKADAAAKVLKALLTPDDSEGTSAGEDGVRGEGLGGNGSGEA